MRVHTPASIPECLHVHMHLHTKICMHTRAAYKNVHTYLLHTHINRAHAIPMASRIPSRPFTHIHTNMHLHEHAYTHTHFTKNFVLHTKGLDAPRFVDVLHTHLTLATSHTPHPRNIAHTLNSHSNWRRAVCEATPATPRRTQARAAPAIRGG